MSPYFFSLSRAPCLSAVFVSTLCGERLYSVQIAFEHTFTLPATNLFFSNPCISNEDAVSLSPEIAKT
jgi:hypothetical protein